MKPRIRLTTAALAGAAALMLAGCGSSHSSSSAASAPSRGSSPSAAIAQASGWPLKISGASQASPEFAVLSYLIGNGPCHCDASRETHFVVVEKRTSSSGLAEIAVHDTSPKPYANYRTFELTPGRGDPKNSYYSNGTWTIVDEKELGFAERAGWGDPLTYEYGS